MRRVKESSGRIGQEERGLASRPVVDELRRGDVLDGKPDGFEDRRLSRVDGLDSGQHFAQLRMDDSEYA